MALLCLAISVVFLLPEVAVEGALGSSSRLAWCGLFWVATLSLPQADRGAMSWSVWLGVALCVLGLAAHLDLAGGLTWGQVWETAWPTLLFLVLLPGAAARARRTGATTRHALLWFVFVPGLPLFVYTIGALGGASAPRWLEFGASASPLSWLWDRGGDSEPWLSLGVALLLYTSAAVSTAPGEEEAA